VPPLLPYLPFQRTISLLSRLTCQADSLCPTPQERDKALRIQYPNVVLEGAVEAAWDKD